MFIVEDGELNFLQEKFGADFKPPARCKSCRQAKKLRNGDQPRQAGGMPPIEEQKIIEDTTERGRRPPKSGRRGRHESYDY